jgi:hypothetical protein
MSEDWQMRLKLLGLAAAALIGSGPLASAAVLVQTESYGPTKTNWGSPTAIALYFPGFNTSLGTLTGLAVSVTQNTSGTLQNQNTGSSASNVSSLLTNKWSVTLPSSVGGKTALSGSVATTPVIDYLVAGATGPLYNVSASGGAYATAVAGDNLSPYESVFVIKASDRGTLSVSSDNGNGKATYTDLGEVLVTVTYIASVGTAPEPAALALLSMGLVSLGLVRRRS